MPTSYTPNAANNPATITLPSDVDDANAESVNLAFRAVADRGAHLQTVAALLAQANVFTVNQQEVSNNDPSTPAWKVTKDAGSSGDAVNYFKNIGEYKIANMSGKWRFYSGRTTGPAHAAVTCNAAWDTTNHRWFADDTGFDSIALLFEQGTGMRLSRRAAGAGTWTDWSAQTSGSFVAQGDVACNGDLITASKVKAATAFEYLAGLGRSTVLPVTSVGGNISGSLIDFASGALIKAASDAALWTISLPNGAALASVDVLINKAGTTVSNFYGEEKSGLNWSVANVGSYTQLNTQTSTTSGLQIKTVAFGGLTVDNTHAYVVRVNGGDNTDAIHALRVNWTDPGPRNH